MKSAIVYQIRYIGVSYSFISRDVCDEWSISPCHVGIDLPTSQRDALVVIEGLDRGLERISCVL